KYIQYRMGNGYSSNWQNKNAQSYLPFLVDLFGKPYFYVDKPQGVAVWLNFNLKGKTLFGQQVCFDKILVKDENILHTDTNPPHYDFVYGFVQVPMQLYQAQSLMQMSDSVGYDRFKKVLWARCQTLDGVIILLKLATDVLMGSTSVSAILTNSTISSLMNSIQVNNPQTGNIDINLVKTLYLALSSNLA